MDGTNHPRPGAAFGDAPYEDPALGADETLVTDDLAADPLDTGVVPPDRYSPAEDYGDTAEEAAQGESLERLLHQEQPDTGPGGFAEMDADDAYAGDPDLGEYARTAIDDRWQGGPGPRTGRLITADGEDHSGELLASDVGIDAGAASAEEAAMHVVEDELELDEFD
ncbi:DUF5709 domain-containing protein [Yinghuangia seranimata]|uniref:DUF5709 domain-containing protein n=1 Tax=Yinghuangia seranimata TaxID=408067 RepID=UPI00248BBB62|nr:DUF5709 domain-containing protein [Yinghuangia seranimata]MDI2129855.1 DUF5709 domain-containing protein [Yinghuangia seranimata]